MNALGPCPHQLPDMPNPALGGRIGKIPYAVNLQRAALYLQQKPFLPALHIKIHSGITVTVLGQHPVESLLPQPLLHHMVGGLAVDVEQHPVCLAHGHQVVGGFSPRCARRREPHLAPRNEQLPAAPGVFHMNAFPVPVQLHLGDKAIGPCQKNSFCNIFVDHGGLLWGRQPLGEWFYRAFQPFHGS